MLSDVRCWLDVVFVSAAGGRLFPGKLFSLHAAKSIPGKSLAKAGAIRADRTQ